MVRTLRLSGLAIVTLALSPLGSPAFAAPAEFHSEAGNPSIRLVQVEPVELTLAGASFACAEGVFEGMSSGTQQPALLIDKIAYNKCKFLFFNTPLEPHGCAYRLNAGEGGVGTFDIVANGHKECEEKGITFSAAGCTMSIFPQNGLKEVKYGNNGKAGSVREIFVTFNLKNIVYDAAGLCPESGKGQKNGKYIKGTSSATGASTTNFGSSEMVGLFYE
jgi:hypothetical protein